MELRTALFIIGIIVIVFIAFVSFHRSHDKPYKLPRKMHRFARNDDNEVDPLFEPRKGPLTARSSVKKSTANSEHVIAELPEDESEIEPAPLIIEEPPADEAANLQLDLQPSGDIADQGPQKAIEFVALIRGSEPITRDQALGVYRQHEYTMEKRNGIYGFNIANGLWRNLEHEEQTSEYRDICLTIQIADADGPVTDSELNRFSQMSLEVAEELDRPIVFSQDFDEALTYAKDLDRFRKEMDIVLVVSIVARSENGLTMNAVHREAEKLGLYYSKDKIYHRIRKNADNRADVLFTMANMFKPGELPKDDLEMHTGGLTLFMRLVAVPNPVDVYTDMMETAASLAKRLNGILVDQETAPINQSMTVKQTKMIMKMVGEMEVREIKPGSDLANRLF